MPTDTVREDMMLFRVRQPIVCYFIRKIRRFIYISCNICSNVEIELYLPVILSSGKVKVYIKLKKGIKILILFK